MSQKEREQLSAELDILRGLRHPNIVAYYEKEHLKASHDLHLYMEYCGNGDLGMMIKDLKARNEYADEEFVWTIFAQLVSALYRCHYGEDPPDVNSNALGLTKNALPLKSKQAHKMILHRDLKPENGMSRLTLAQHPHPDMILQFFSVKATQSSSVTLVCPRLFFPTISPPPTSALPFTCRPKSAPPNATPYTRTSGHWAA